MLQSPYTFRFRSKVLLYSHRLSEIVLSHDRRSNASLGALSAMLLFPLIFRWKVGQCFSHFCPVTPTFLGKDISQHDGALWAV